MISMESAKQLYGLAILCQAFTISASLDPVGTKRMMWEEKSITENLNLAMP